MTSIRYKAINESNKVIFGMISSDQLDQLESLLFERGLRLISYRHQRQKHTKLYLMINNKHYGCHYDII
jgi:type II secretory pathway component PulF